MKQVYAGMRMMFDYTNGISKTSKLRHSSDDDTNPLNVFYIRFDFHDFSNEAV